MAGLQDTLAGSETRRYGDTVGVPHAEDDGTLVSDAAVQPGDVVAIDASTGEMALAQDDTTPDVDDVLGVLVNYEVYGASHQGEKIKGDVDANVAVQGTYKARADDSAAAGGYVDAGTTAGQFASGDKFRVVDEYTDGDSQQWVEVVL